MSTFEWRVRSNRKLAVSFRAAQRPALLALCKAYRTTSTEALCVLAGILPLDYLIMIRAAMYKLRRGTPVSWGTRDFEPGNNSGAWQERTRQELRECAVGEWQTEWENSQKGRLTYSFLPRIGDRLEADWLVTNKPVTYLVTGHGPWGAYLERFSLRESAPACRCGDPVHTVGHVLWDCPVVASYRREALGKLRELNGGCTPAGGWSNSDWLSCRDAYRVFSGFANEIVRRCQAPDDTEEG